MRPLAEPRPAVAEHPRVSVVVGAKATTDAERLEQLAQRFHRMSLAGVLVVVRDLGDGGVRLRVLELEPRHEHPAASVGRERERDRPLRRNEEEAGVVVDVLRVEQHGAGEPAFLECRCERFAACGVLLLGDPHAASCARVERT